MSEYTISAIPRPRIVAQPIYYPPLRISQPKRQTFEIVLPLRRKRRPREDPQSSGSSSSSSSSSSPSRHNPPTGQTRDDAIDIDEDEPQAAVSSLEESCMREGGIRCGWSRCDAVLASVNLAIKHYRRHFKETNTCRWKMCNRFVIDPRGHFKQYHGYRLPPMMPHTPRPIAIHVPPPTERLQTLPPYLLSTLPVRNTAYTPHPSGTSDDAFEASGCESTRDGQGASGSFVRVAHPPKLAPQEIAMRAYIQRPHNPPPRSYTPMSVGERIQSRIPFTSVHAGFQPTPTVTTDTTDTTDKPDPPQDLVRRAAKRIADEVVGTTIGADFWCTVIEFEEMGR